MTQEKAKAVCETVDLGIWNNFDTEAIFGVLVRLLQEQGCTFAIAYRDLDPADDLGGHAWEEDVVRAACKLLNPEAIKAGLKAYYDEAPNPNTPWCDAMPAGVVGCWVRWQERGAVTC